MGATTTQTLHSVCEECLDQIAITIDAGQRWDQVEWQHIDTAPADHEPKPELRFAIDATCPGCEYPEIGFAPARQEFVCSRCGYTSSERPPS